MESIVNDATEPTDDDVVAEEPETEQVGSASADESGVDDPPADESAMDDESGEQTDRADTISGEQARKLRSEASNLRHRLKQAEGELEQLRAQVAERDERLNAAESGRLDAMIYSRAAGKLQNPADAVVFLDRADLSADDVQGIDAAIEALLTERQYLRSGASIPQIDQGVQRERPRGKTFSDVMAEGLGWKPQ